MCIHLSFSLTSVFMSYFKTSCDIIVVLCNKHMSTFNINSSICIFLYMQLMLFSIVTKQILNFFHINFNEATSNEILSLLAVRIDDLKNMLKRSWHYSSFISRVRVPNHRMRFSTTCLAVCEYCSFKLSLTYHYSQL